jgi:hypothetical protein
MECTLPARPRGVEALPAFELASKWKGKGIFNVASAKIGENGGWAG